MDFIDLKTQQTAIKETLDQRIADVLAHGRYIMGPEVAELETTLADYVGTKHCVSVASGTEALLISLMALGIKQGDEVITTPFTFVATGEMIALTGATPVFVDVHPHTANIDALAVKAAITPKTKAIIPVSLYGQTADMDAIQKVADDAGGIPVIEDGAQSFGANYNGRKSCGLSTFGCTSFFPSKPLGCYGDGGALFTNDDALAQASREIRVHGQSKRYVHTRIGVGGRMDTIQCAVLLAKWPRFEWEVTQRGNIGARYNELILDQVPNARPMAADDTDDPIDTIRTLEVSKAGTSVHAQYTILAPDREAVKTALGDAAIPTAVHYPVPLNQQPAYTGLAKPGHPTPIAKRLSDHVISLPMGPDLTENDQKRIVEVLATAV